MHCPACQRAMMSTSYQVFEDERGAMTISRWRCRPCRETAEEIRLSAWLSWPRTNENPLCSGVAAGVSGHDTGACACQEGSPRPCGRPLTSCGSIGLNI